MKNKFKVKEERKKTKKENRKEDLDTERKFETNLQRFIPPQVDVLLQKEEEQRKLRAIRNQRRKYEMKKREKMNTA